MKINVVVLSLVLIFGNLFAINAQEKKNSTLATVTFDVSIHCNDCKNKIEKNISWEKGVKDLSVSVEKKTVTVTFDTKQTSKENLQKAIEKLGFTCSTKNSDGCSQSCKQSCDKSKGEKEGCCKKGEAASCQKAGADQKCDKTKAGGASCATKAKTASCATAKANGTTCEKAKAEGAACAKVEEKK